MAIPQAAAIAYSSIAAGSTAYVVADFLGVTPDAFKSYWDETSDTVGNFFSSKSDTYVPGRKGKYSRKPAVSRKRAKGREIPETKGTDVIDRTVGKLDETLDNVSQFASSHGDSIEKIAILTAAIDPNLAKAGAAVILVSDILSGVYSSRSDEANPSSLIDKVKPILTTLAVGAISSKL